MSRKRRRRQGPGPRPGNGHANGGPQSPKPDRGEFGENDQEAPGYLFDLSEEICRTNRPFPICEVEGVQIMIQLLPACLAEDWLANKAHPADELEEDRATAFRRLQQAQVKSRALDVYEPDETIKAADVLVERYGKQVSDLKIRRLRMIREAVGAFADTLAAVVDKLTVVQLYEVFIRLVKYSDPGLVGGSLQVTHMLGTSSGRQAFRQLIEETPNSGRSGPR